MDRILMISYFAPPLLSAESILVGKLLPELAKHYQIELIAVGDDPDFRKDEALSELMQTDNLEVYRYSNPKPINKIVRRLYQKSSPLFHDVNDKWLRQVLLRHKPKGPYKLIYSRSMPAISHLTALAYKQKLGIPWVAQFSDPWANNPYHKYPLEWMHALEKKNESKVVHAAERLIFPTTEIRDLVAAHYDDVDVKARSTILPHYYDERLYTMSEVTNEGAARQASQDRLTLAYIGDFYGLRSPEPLLKALEIMQQRAPELTSRLHLRIIGNVQSIFHRMIDETTAKTGITIERVGQVPYLQSLAEMKHSDVLLLVDAPTDINIFLPSKLIDYFGARKPMMGITSEFGTTGSLIRKFGFPVADPREPERVAADLLQLLDNLEESRSRAATNDYEMFTAKAVAEELANLFARV